MVHYSALPLSLPSVAKTRGPFSLIPVLARARRPLMRSGMFCGFKYRYAMNSSTCWFDPLRLMQWFTFVPIDPACFHGRCSPDGNWHSTSWWSHPSLETQSRLCKFSARRRIVLLNNLHLFFRPRTSSIDLFTILFWVMAGRSSAIFLRYGVVYCTTFQRCPRMEYITFHPED